MYVSPLYIYIYEYTVYTCTIYYYIFVGKNHRNGDQLLELLRDNAAQYAVDAMRSVRGWAISQCDIDYTRWDPPIISWFINPMNAVVIISYI